MEVGLDRFRVECAESSVVVSEHLGHSRLVIVCQLHLCLPLGTAWCGGRFSQCAGVLSRSSERPVASRGHCDRSSSPATLATGGQSGPPPLVRVMEHCCGQPGGESSDDS